MAKQSGSRGPGLLGAVGGGAGDLRRRLSVRARAAGLPAGRRLRSGGGARPSRARRINSTASSSTRAPTWSRPSRTTPPREAEGDRQGGDPRAAEPPGAPDRQGGRRRERLPARGQHLATPTSTTRTTRKRSASSAARSRSRSAGRSRRASTSSSARPQLARRDADGAGRDQGLGQARRDDAGDPRRARCRMAWAWSRRASGWKTPAPTSSGSTARGGRDDAAGAPADPRRGRRSRGGAARAVPDHAGAADLPVAARSRLRLPPERPAVPGRARPVHLQPLRDRRVRPPAYALGIRYLGVCCGAGPHHIRAMAEASGASRRPAATRRT